MKIIDSHLHFWNPQRLRYPWLESVPELNRPFEAAEFRQATENLSIDGLVFVEADCAPEQNIAEVEYVESLTVPIKGIVAYAPLETGSAAKCALDQLSVTTAGQGDSAAGTRRSGRLCSAAQVY